MKELKSLLFIHETAHQCYSQNPVLLLHQMLYFSATLHERCKGKTQNCLKRWKSLKFSWHYEDIIQHRHCRSNKEITALCAVENNVFPGIHFWSN
jgi:uncharacterized metal-binding protein